MMTVRSSNLLTRLLLVDAVISGATGLLMLLGANAVDGLFGIPAPVIFYSGLALLPFAAMVLYFATSEGLSRRKAWTVILMNFAWVAASFLLLVTDWIDPTAAGITFVVVQALAVAALAEFQYSALHTISNP
jgi:hypothetical protein